MKFQILNNQFQKGGSCSKRNEDWVFPLFVTNHHWVLKTVSGIKNNDYIVKQ